MRDDAVLGRALPLDRGLGPIFNEHNILYIHKQKDDADKRKQKHTCQCGRNTKLACVQIPSKLNDCMPIQGVQRKPCMLPPFDGNF